jgi:hypothetical protein
MDHQQFMAWQNQPASPAQPPLFHAVYCSSIPQLLLWGFLLLQNISERMEIQFINTLDEMTTSLIVVQLHEHK